MKQPYEECPRFNRCSVNKCPLDALYTKRSVHPDDPEKKCKLSKAKRVEIASRYPGVTPFDGMTKREHSATLRCQSEGVRRKLAQQGKKTRFSPLSEVRGKNGIQVPSEAQA